jgi:hypothetical protein
VLFATIDPGSTLVASDFRVIGRIFIGPSGAPSCGPPYSADRLDRPQRRPPASDQARTSGWPERFDKGHHSNAVAHLAQALKVG